jgi:hypothetical protein
LIVQNNKWRSAFAGFAFVVFGPVLAQADEPGGSVDTALIVSVDVSNSVDDERYKLQMEGIAEALEDPGVIGAILNGPKGGILFSLVTWADRPQITLPWRHITSREEAKATAEAVRKLPRQSGQFTCMSRMMRAMSDKMVTQVPMKATRVVIDVSGDGPDNCNSDDPVTLVRDDLVAAGVTVNGLPILENADKPAADAGGTPSTGLKSFAPPIAKNDASPNSLEDWYRQHVMGGPGSFVLPAYGYSDFGRAIRQKFVIEISGIEPIQLPVRRSGAAHGNPRIVAER